MNTSSKLCAVLAGAMWMAASTAAPPAPAPAGSAPSDQPARHASKSDLMQSRAMRDALGVAGQAVGFASSHPDASEADARAAANGLMQRIFQRELQDGSGGGPARPSRRQSSSGPLPDDAVRRAGYEASRAFHNDPDSQETADAIRRLIRAADGKSKPSHNDDGH